MKRLLIFFCLSLTGLYLFLKYTELSFNRTGSLPHSVFFVIRGLPYKKGDLVCIKGHETKYFNGVSFTKRIVGVEGKAIAPHLKNLKSETKHGKPLTPLKMDTVPKGYVFVKADHPRSFDSRYQEFGLVRREHIYGRAYPLW